MSSDTIQVMNYALALAIRAMNPADTEAFVEEHRTELVQKDHTLLGGLDVTGNLDVIVGLDGSDLKKVQSSLIWYLCFDPETNYMGSLLDEISADAWNAQDTNRTFIDGMGDDVELTYTIVENRYLDSLYRAELASKDWIVNRVGAESADEMLAQFQTMIERVRADPNLRLSYWYDY